ncbi:group III truncated hemoglobin [Gillisia sp. Hel_I_86]|uniref:group III truncated hemoglobin n=1 Tax=Gillisia sp. Hel_I_86 TaxID=1249981 RepID=UPI0011A30E02|nr:group III truncated hemoglobin [Gillisia sp. Hel_I_86]
MKKDISTREDIQLLVDSFYMQVKEDPTIGYIFNDVAKVDWDKHLPKMYSFWETLLLGKMSFKGNPIQKHMELSKNTEINKVHFDQWLFLWSGTIDAHFEGPIAEEAKTKGKSIAGLMLFKIEQFSSK